MLKTIGSKPLIDIISCRGIASHRSAADIVKMHHQ